MACVADLWVRMVVAEVVGVAGVGVAVEIVAMGAVTFPHVQGLGPRMVRCHLGEELDE